MNQSHLIFLPRGAASLWIVHHLLLAMGRAPCWGEAKQNWIWKPAQGKIYDEPSFVIGDSGSPTLVPHNDETIVWFREENVIVAFSPGTGCRRWWWRWRGAERESEPYQNLRVWCVGFGQKQALVILATIWWADSIIMDIERVTDSLFRSSHIRLLQVIMISVHFYLYHCGPSHC